MVSFPGADNYQFTFFLHKLSYSGILHKWNYTNMVFVLQPVSFSIMFSSFIYVVTHQFFISFYGWIIFCCITFCSYIHQLMGILILSTSQMLLIMQLKQYTNFFFICIRCLSICDAFSNPLSHWPSQILWATRQPHYFDFIGRETGLFYFFRKNCLI